MVNTIKYPDNKEPLIVIGIESSGRFDIPNNVLKGMVNSTYDKTYSQIIAVIPQGSKLLFLVLGNECYTYEGVWVDYLGSGGFKIVQNHTVLYEHVKRINVKYWLKRILRVLVILTAVTLITVSIKKCTEREIPPVNQREEISVDTNKDSVPPPSPIPIRKQSQMENENATPTQDTMTKITPIRESRNVHKPQITRSSGYTSQSQQPIHIDCPQQQSEVRSPQNNTDAEFEKCKIKGLNAYKKYYLDGHEEDRILAIKYFERALKYKNDVEIQKIINQLKSK